MRERLPLFLLAGGTVAVLGWILWFCGFGLDFTDESFYLVWISNPFLYPVSVSQFGFVYHPLYDLLDGNIARLRQANLLITVGLAWWTVTVFFRSVYGETLMRRGARLVVAGALALCAASSLVFAGAWLATPSYNTLGLQGLLLAAIGLMLAGKGAGGGVIGAALLGTGGWLAFMAKPTTAAALAVLVVIYLVLSGRLLFQWLLVVLLVAVGWVVATAHVIDGSLSLFAARLANSLEFSSLLGSGHDAGGVLRMDDVDLGQRGNNLLLLFVSGVFVSVYGGQTNAKPVAWAGDVVVLASAGLMALMMAGLPWHPFQLGPFQGLFLLSVPLAAALFAFFTSQVNDLADVSRRDWALGMVLLLFPHAYAFGSGNHYWVMAGNAGIFWVLAGLVLLKPVAGKPAFLLVLPRVGISALLATVVVLHAGIQAPYRQPGPLRDNDYAIDIGRPGSTLLLSREFGAYFARAIEGARQAGFRAGTPVIDLSGRSPGILYALGARSIGQAWMLGGYPGSARLASASLKSASCQELADAWVLVEPQGLGRIDLDVLSSYGAGAGTDFEVAARFQTAPGAGSHTEAKEQQLLKPTRDRGAAAGVCAAQRAAAT